MKKILISLALLATSQLSAVESKPNKMFETYVLIMQVNVNGGYDGGISLFAQEFYSKNSCEKAMNLFKKTMRKPKAFCTRK